MLIPRAKSVIANVMLAGFCFFWWWVIYESAGAMRLLLGPMFAFVLWPAGVYYLYSAATLRVEDDLVPAEPASESIDDVRPAGCAEDNRSALLSYFSSGTYPRSKARLLADFLSDFFGTEQWDGDPHSKRLAEGWNAYCRHQEKHPQLSVALRELQVLGESVRALEPSGWYWDSISAALMERVRRAPNTPITRLYAAKGFMRGATADVGLAVVDVEEQADYLFLYELWVCRQFRGEGYGTAILTAVEDLAWKVGRPAVRLRPRRIDASSSNNGPQLTAWYTARGYSELESGILQKRVT